MFRGLMIVALMGVAGCNSAGTDSRDGGGTASQDCSASDFEGLIGQNIAAVTLPDDLYHRVVPPNSAVTMDYQPTRLNFRTDAQGTIQDVSCG